jgi:Ni/Co efflux regulator RcnB
MKYKTMTCLVALALGTSSLSFAQGYDQRRGDDRGGYSRGDRGDRNERYGRSMDYRDSRGDERHYGARGPEWRRGGHVPYEYRSRQYVVDDWRSHRLHAPPRGYHWVQVGNDYVLVAVASGIIAQLILSQ